MSTKKGDDCLICRRQKKRRLKNVSRFDFPSELLIKYFLTFSQNRRVEQKNPFERLKKKVTK